MNDLLIYVTSNTIPLSLPTYSRKNKNKKEKKIGGLNASLFAICACFSQSLNYRLGNKKTFSHINYSFSKAAAVLTCVYSTSPSKTLWEKEKLPNEQFILFLECFLPIWKTFCLFHLSSPNSISLEAPRPGDSVVHVSES